MDPTANLEEQRRLIETIHTLTEQAYDDKTSAAKKQRAIEALADRASRLAELVHALDKWIVGGGFLPAPWHGRWKVRP